MLLWTVILTIYFGIMATVKRLRHYSLSRLGAVWDSNISNVRLDLCYKLYNLNIGYKFDVLLYTYLMLKFNSNCRRFRDKKEAAEPEADPERDQRTVFAYQVD